MAPRWAAASIPGLAHSLRRCRQKQANAHIFLQSHPVGRGLPRSDHRNPGDFRQSPISQHKAEWADHGSCAKEGDRAETGTGLCVLVSSKPWLSRPSHLHRITCSPGPIPWGTPGVGGRFSAAPRTLEAFYSRPVLLQHPKESCVIQIPGPNSKTPRRQALGLPVRAHPPIQALAPCQPCEHLALDAESSTLY